MSTPLRRHFAACCFLFVVCLFSTASAPLAAQPSKASAAAPTPPNHLRIDASSVTASQVFLNWACTSATTSCNVYRSTTSGGNYVQIAAGISATSGYTDTPPAASTPYYYVVTAVNAGAESSFSTVVSTTLASSTIVTNLTAQARYYYDWYYPAGSEQYVQLSWTPPQPSPSYNSYYTIERKTGANGTWATLDTIGVESGGYYFSGYNDPELGHAKLPASTAFVYRVRFNTSSGPSAPSSEASVTTLAAPPPAPPTPTGLLGAPSDGAATLTWNGSPQANYYVVSYSGIYDDGYANIWVAAPATGTTVTFPVTGLTNGEYYSFYVTAVTIDPANTTESNTSYSQSSDLVTVVPAAHPVNAASVKIDCGSSAPYKDSMGNTWAADQYFDTGTADVPNPPPAISSTSDPMLFQTQHVGSSFTYNLSVLNGTYIAGLSFAEIDGKTKGQRLINVRANGKWVLRGFDPYAAAGGANVAITKTFLVTATGGQVTLDFAGGSGQACVSAISLTPISPAGDIPAPGWAEDVLPTDDASDADGMGPAAASAVNLASGVEENSPGPDLWAYNPLGPSASYERRYRSARAQKGYASPGLSPGWTDSYDLVVTPTANGYTLTYDNGGQDLWTGMSGSLGTPAGAPYLVTASGGAITMTFKDRSKYIFTQISRAGGNYPTNSYLLTGIVNLVGHAITLNRDPANSYRVVSITNDASPSATLLSFAYNGDGTLGSVTDPVGGRQVSYGFSGGLLTSVSQIAATSTTGPARWQYGYIPVGGVSLLNTVSAPDPSNPGSLAAAITSYDPATGAVSRHKDASGRVHSYGYGGGSTLVQVSNSDGSLAEAWTQKQNMGGGMNADAGTTDAAGKADSVAYGGMSSPYLPTAATNRNSQTSKVTYNDNYGNVLSTTSPRGVVSTFSYANPSDFLLNQVASVTESTTAGDQKQPTSFTYYGPSDGAINGLLHTASSPRPDSTSASPGTPVTTTYSYDSLGNVTQTTGPNANGTMTVMYNYTTDGAFSQPEALGQPLVVTVSGPDAYGATTTTVTQYRYDARGNRTAVIDAVGNETDFAYNLADQLTDTLYPATGDSGNGRTRTTTAYQYVGGPESGTSVFDESGASFRQVANVYDAEGELLTVTGDTYPVLNHYDGRGRVSSVTYYGQSLLFGANTTYYDYDAVGNLADVRYPGQSGPNYDMMQYFYDADNNLIKEIDGIGLEKDYLRADPESLMTGIHYVYPSGYTGTKIGDVSTAYDHYGRRASLTDGTGSKTYTYDDLDALTGFIPNFGYDPAAAQQGPQGEQLTYSHNPDGSRRLRGSNNSDTQQYAYDGVGRLLFTYLPYAGVGENYSYLANGWLSRKQAFSVVSNRIQPYLQADKTYNPRGFLTTLTNSLLTNAATGTTARSLSSFSGMNPARMTYDPVGNRLQELATVPAYSNAPNLSRTIQYGYDRLDQLTQETSTATGGTAAISYANSFSYDLAGNPMSSRLGGFNFNADNQNAFTQFNNGSQGALSYNGNGDPLALPYTGQNLSQKTYPTAYDPEDRLTSGFQAELSATYDGDGLRAWSEFGPNQNTGPALYYLYDPGSSAPILEEDYSGQEDFYNVYGADGLAGRYIAYPAVGDPTQIAFTTSTYDPQGSVVEPVSFYPSGFNGPGVSVATSSAYDAFGGYHLYGAQGQYDQFNPVGFGGQFGYYKDYTGYYLLGHRYYDPRAGRFVTRDPIGYGGGINLYGFVGNNPVNRSDPSGYTSSLTRNYPDSQSSNPFLRTLAIGLQQTRDFLDGIINRNFGPSVDVYPVGQVPPCGCSSGFPVHFFPHDTPQGMSMMAGKGGKLPGGLKDASPGLKELFSEGKVGGRSIIGIRQTLLKNGFKMSKANTKGYIFRMPGKNVEHVRIMSRAGGWDVRIQNEGGGWLDEVGNQVTGRNASHGINVFSK